jgi:hypothetical protein
MSEIWQAGRGFSQGWLGTAFGAAAPGPAVLGAIGAWVSRG